MKYLVSRLPSLALLPLSIPAAAADAPVAPAGSTTQMLLGLLLVLGAVVAAAWFAKRFVPRHPAAGNALRVVAGAAVGQRERVVVVEVGSTWIVVGVAPGSVRALHTLPRIDTPAPAPSPAATQPGFAHWLKQFTEKRGGR
jgi:flagellar protein FliO/FliZ